MEACTYGAIDTANKGFIDRQNVSDVENVSASAPQGLLHLRVRI